MKVLALSAASAASAAAMYYLDPEMGRRRRATTRDQVGAASRQASHYTRVQGRHLAHRAQGWLASARQSFERLSRPRSDEELRERICAQLGRWTSEPGAIEVVVNEGHVSLRGRVLAEEADRLLAAVLDMRGVKHIDNRLEAHDAPGSETTVRAQPRTHRQGTAARRPVLPFVALAAPVVLMMRARRRANRQDMDGDRLPH